MKNLLKILLIIAFANPVFASSMQMPDPASVTTTQIHAMSTNAQQDWIASLTANQYNMLSPDVQKWVMENTTDAQKQALGINQ
ncbi:DUF2673 domain-containing protein [Rickettsia prowazekii]|uniref:Uncharacterized protein RP697 n=2 Tax=Rickettsia prowazekii TaxID=782 RepID=Y697_RICPR|nr:DUF2673 domain-containing protein [Rickettsia prowazekii]Q9ZCM7.1 RecName: Full=Uncharacterized protein RP697; Flags: Precursor [Rickettsia prowazekii str. Madrid E]EOB09286.1 hypothetical protein H376_9710 [Rickettsia prowazekii str. GvF12]ADE30245.1 hypothetical protein rpr22_CDS674 [Rickettsia prowazekii str. Rp22]AFE49494.1 hypothetical protein M9W_03345 [Rickettsia prowazekii str. Chernikova]AFE50338.1 hypothetical protein M9Y_03350 [Rickettsia prowazekii str. Katsinyian]AFE51184.1 hy